MKHETATMHRLMLEASRLGWRLLRNNIGVAYMGAPERIMKTAMVPVRKGDVVIRQARMVRFGLGGSGGADLIGIKPLTIGPEHVGMTLGQFAAVEVKTAGGKVSADQKVFLSAVKQYGGLALVARTVDDLQS